MSDEIQDQKICDELNDAARAILADKDKGIGNPITALEQAAYARGFTMEVDDGGQCILWTDGTTRINLWVDAPSDEIEDGGLGFDTQTEWADRFVK